MMEKGSSFKKQVDVKHVRAYASAEDETRSFVHVIIVIA